MRRYITVEELIEILKKLDPKATVGLFFNDEHETSLGVLVGPGKSAELILIELSVP